MHREIEGLLRRANHDLPGYKRTGELVRDAGREGWKKYSKNCVSCGACTTICPTCSCFTLIDKPGFHKVKQMDACQYPGFERVAGGEDSLKELPSRFRNRYMCKYVWKPLRFKSLACTGCGRCIEACIGRINKNEIFLEMAK
jgi:ferredoxin